eukprot:gnl/MRDRNA2_/MRDRNA2_98398_c0_seq1.p1 gnl/MRDRNA2_/MRDRNA2_98398_c0~~gnl/MRDRNA2_/MRDRNA2_98398_c0_seq1.p1  ORF type:complete len:590 (+),score=125.49 gnl/MRDRNA2_/MRDRNA2_98398_c0_seq1:107-1876(+)
MADHHVEDMSAAEMKVEAMLDMMTKDKQCFPQILASLPPEIAEFLNSSDFAEACHRSFKELDQDGNGVLTNDELLPLLHQMLHDQFEEHHFAVTQDHSKRLMEVFDADGNGVLCLAEWTEFAKYVAAYTLLEAQCAGQHASTDPGFHGEPSVEAILQVLREDRRQLYQDLPTLPDWLRKLFESEEFTNSLRRHYHHHDEEGAGAVHVERLFPLVASLSQAHPLKVTHSHCQELMRIYDDCSRGHLSFKEFAEFTEFTFIMSCLLNGPQANPEDVRKGHTTETVADLGGESDQAVSQADSALLAAQAQIRGMNNEMAWLAQQLDENAPEVDMEMGGTGMSQVGETPSPEEMRGIVQDMRHLQLDLDFSHRKVESLEEEKRELLQVQTRLQNQVRALQQRTEESEQKLQHQELDMRSMVTSDSLSAGPSQLLSAGPSILEGDPSTLEGVPRGLEKMSRAQAISALQLLHHELDKERKAREKAERRAQKCLERLHRLMGTVERQRDDMSIMEKRCRAMESIAGDRERRLQEGLSQADSLRTLLRNLSEEPAVGFQRPQAGQKKQQRGPAGPLGGPLTRQRSAPNSLPVVHKR